MPSAKPKKKPKLTMKRSSLSPTSRKIRLASSGWASIRWITISFRSTSWSKWVPI